MALLPVPEPTHTLIQLSDLHIVPEGQLFHGNIDTYANLSAAFDQIEAAGIAVSAVVLSGDLTEDGDLESYQRLRAFVAERAPRLGAPVLFVMGNHDSRGPLREGLFDAEPSTEPLDYVYWCSGLRIVVLDSSEPGHGTGLLTEEQLAWLAAELATPAPAGTVLTMHHPPLPSPIQLMSGLRLAEPERLAKVIAGSDVRMILCGHAHHPSGGALAGIPVWVTGAVSYLSRTLGYDHGFAGYPAGAFTRVDVYPDQAVATPVPLRPGDTLFEVPPELLAAQHGGRP